MRNGNRIVRDGRRERAEFGFLGGLKAGHQKRQNNAGRSMVDADFIAEMIAARAGRSRVTGSDRGLLRVTVTRPYHLTSEPGALAVVAIGIAELCFQHCGFAARPDESASESAAAKSTSNSGRPTMRTTPTQKNFSGNVNRIADARVDAGGDQRGRFRARWRTTGRACSGRESRPRGRSRRTANRSSEPGRAALGHRAKYPANDPQAREQRQPDAPYRSTVHLCLWLLSPLVVTSYFTNPWRMARFMPTLLIVGKHRKRIFGVHRVSRSVETPCERGPAGALRLAALRRYDDRRHDDK